MARKRRNAAKTGDKKLYSSRGQLTSGKDGVSNQKNNHDGDHDDDSVDAFHKDRDFLRLDDSTTNTNQHQDDSWGQNEPTRTHQVLDLGIGSDGSSSEEENDNDNDDDDSSVDSQGSASKPIDPTDSSSDDDDSDDDDDDDLEEMDPKDTTNWGRKKSAYYNADTGDLEIGQDQEDAFIEEEAAKEVQASRFLEMASDDFELSDDNDEEDENDDNQNDKGTKQSLAMRDTSKLTLKEQRKLLKKQHPELLPLVSYFGDIMKELQSSTSVATRALMDSDDTAKSVGATQKGLQYLLTKLMMEQSMVLNTVLYLILKSNMAMDTTDEDARNIASHPVMEHLKRANSIRTKFGDHVSSKVNSIQEQIDNLVKAAKLLQSSDHIVSDDNQEDEAGVDNDDESANSEQAEDEEMANAEQDEIEQDRLAEAQSKTPSVQLSKSHERVLDEARFALRPHEIERPKEKVRRKASKAVDSGDLDDDKSTPKSFASTINAIQQRSKTLLRKSKAAPSTEQLDDPEENDGMLAEGIKMMEEQLGKSYDDNDEEDMAPGEVMDTDSEVDGELDDGLDFYNAVAKKSQAKKSLKKQLYNVAPKFPTQEMEVEGERAISKTILKNRGLVAHKAKINRNPRVKKREQYRKALIKRKGAVRQVRTGESDKYAGEETGIKTRISRSRKLVS